MTEQIMGEVTSPLPVLSRKDVSDQIRGRVRKALHKLGGTEHEVHAVLLANECYGFKGECRTDPIAIWLGKTLATSSDIQVHADFVKITSAMGTYVICVDLPDPVKAFIAGFDQTNEYDNLDAEQLVARNDDWDDESWSRIWDVLNG
jgi:hypothetical protein